MTPWQRAKLLRMLAAKAKTRTTAQSLYAQARHYEKASFEDQTQVQDNANPHAVGKDPLAKSYHLPQFFKDAWNNLRCSKCKSKNLVYWYRQTPKGYSRTRLIPSIRRLNLDRVKALMSTSVPLCRKCAEKNNES